MHVRLLIAMIALTVIPVILLQAFYTRYMMDHVRTNRIDLVRNYGALIGEEMLKADYLKGKASAVIDGEIQQFSGLYDGRIVVTDADFTVRMDTYGMLTYKKLVSEEVVLALQDAELSHYDKHSDQVWLTYVIRDKAKDRISGMILFLYRVKI